MSTSRAARAREILEWCKMCGEGEPFTRQDCADGLGMVNDGSFSEDFSAARHLALDENSQITYAQFSEGRHVYFYETARRHEAAGMAGLLVRQRAIATQSHNLAKHAEFEAEHPVSKHHAKIARMSEKVARMVADNAARGTEILEELSE